MICGQCHKPCMWVHVVEGTCPGCDDANYANEIKRAELVPLVDLQTEVVLLRRLERAARKLWHTTIGKPDKKWWRVEAKAMRKMVEVGEALFDLRHPDGDET